MRSRWHEARHVLGPHDRDDERTQVAIDGRYEERPARPQQTGEGIDSAGGLGQMFEHLHAGDDIETALALVGQRLDRLQAVVDVETGARCMQPRDVDHGGG